MLAAPLLAAVLAAQPAAPSLAVMTLTAETGVESSSTRLITDVLLQELQSTHAFARVVSSRELESVMGLEAQRQLLQCTDGSCVAELSGALGVDLLITGSVGRLGEALVMTLRLVDARNGSLKATRSVTLRKADESELIDAVRPALALLLREGGVRGIPAEKAAPDEKPAGPPVLRAAGIAGLAAAGVGAVLALVLAAAGTLSVVIPTILYVPTPGLPWQARIALMPGAGLAGAGLGALVLVVGALLGLGGIALIAAQAVMG